MDPAPRPQAKRRSRSGKSGWANWRAKNPAPAAGPPALQAAGDNPAAPAAAPAQQALQAGGDNPPAQPGRFVEQPLGAGEAVLPQPSSPVPLGAGDAQPSSPVEQALLGESPEEALVEQSASPVEQPLGAELDNKRPRSSGAEAEASRPVKPRLELQHGVAAVNVHGAAVQSTRTQTPDWSTDYRAGLPQHSPTPRLWLKRSPSFHELVKARA